MTDDVAILMPIRDEPCEPTRSCIAKNLPPHRMLTVVGEPVDVARNRLTRMAMDLQPRPAFVVWIDDDAVFTAGTIEQLIRDLQRLPQLALVGGLACTRGAVFPLGPTIAATFDSRPTRAGERWSDRLPLVGKHFPKHPADPKALLNLGPYGAMGAHMIAHRIDLLDAIGSDPWTLGVDDLGEDVAFCRRVIRSGGQVVLDTACPVIHFDADHGVGYLPSFPPMTMDAAGKWVPTIAIPRTEIARSYGPAVDAKRSSQLRKAG